MQSSPPGLLLVGSNPHKPSFVTGILGGAPKHIYVSLEGLGALKPTVQVVTSNAWLRNRSRVLRRVDAQNAWEVDHDFQKTLGDVNHLGWS